MSERKTKEAYYKELLREERRSSTTYAAYRKTEILNDSDHQPFGFAFERLGTRYIIGFKKTSAGIAEEVAEFHRVAGNSAALWEAMIPSEAEWALATITGELSGPDRERFASELERLRRNLPAPVVSVGPKTPGLE